MLSSWGLQALEPVGSVVASAGLVAPRHGESSWTRDRTCVPYISRQYGFLTPRPLKKSSLVLFIVQIY